MNNKYWIIMNIHSEISKLYSNTKALWNNYYSGVATEYFKEDIIKINEIINNIEDNIKNIREEIEHYD